MGRPPSTRSINTRMQCSDPRSNTNRLQSLAALAGAQLSPCVCEKRASRHKEICGVVVDGSCGPWVATCIWFLMVRVESGGHELPPSTTPTTHPAHHPLTTHPPTHPPPNPATHPVATLAIWTCVVSHRHHRAGWEAGCV